MQAISPYLAVANVALPSIGSAFDASQISLNLVAVGYSLGLAASVLFLGFAPRMRRLADRYLYRPAYDTRALVALLCSGFTVGLMNIETRDSASDYRSSENVGFGAASLELDARYNIGKYFHVGLTVAGEAWLGELSAQRADGSELFRSRLFNGSALLGLGLHF